MSLRSELRRDDDDVDDDTTSSYKRLHRVKLVARRARATKVTEASVFVRVAVPG